MRSDDSESVRKYALRVVHYKASMSILLLHRPSNVNTRGDTAVQKSKFLEKIFLIARQFRN